MNSYFVVIDQYGVETFSYSDAHKYINKQSNIEWIGDFDSGNEIKILLTQTHFTKGGYPEPSPESMETLHMSMMLNILSDKGITFLKYDESQWILDAEEFKTQASLSNCDWIKGEILLNPLFGFFKREAFDVTYNFWAISFNISKVTMEKQLSTKIFLSHSSIDKPLVRQYKEILKEIGFEPWLDEDAMIAGVELERSLLAGFEDSCAAVFFITSNFIDAKYLSTEVNYAIQQKRKKGDKFSIIVLQIDSDAGHGEIPELLKQYVWKTPMSQTEALIEIMRALPLRLPKPRWNNNLK